MIPSKSLILSAAFGGLLTVSAFGQVVNPVSRRGGSTVQPPAPVSPINQPAPIVTPPPPQAVPIPPPAPQAPAGPLLVATLSGLGTGTELSSTLQQLNTAIENYNRNGANLPLATLDGASQQTLSTNAGTIAPPVSTPPPSSSSSLVVPTNRRGRAETPPAGDNTAPQSITQIDLDVTGFKFIVLKWGAVNHHFYVGESSGVQTFRGTAPLSSYSTYFATAPSVSVPDSGKSGLLLLAALTTLGVLRHRRRK